MIQGGYYIKSRKIQESEIAFAPPHVREIWDWLLREANHKDVKVGGKVVKRGQTIRSYRDIQDGLHWMVGFRKETYNKWQCEIAMKWLTKREMVATTKTTRGLLITICNYDKYQDPQNYENHSESHMKATRKPQGTDTINKNEKNEKNENSNKPEKISGGKYDFIDKIILEFKEAYESANSLPYEITAIGKERGLAGKILKLYKKKNPGANSEQTIQDLRKYFDMCVTIEDDFLNEGMNLGMIISQFNKINRILRHGKQRKGKGASDGEIAEIIARHFGSDSPER